MLDGVKLSFLEKVTLCHATTSLLSQLSSSRGGGARLGKKTELDSVFDPCFTPSTAAAAAAAAAAHWVSCQAAAAAAKAAVEQNFGFLSFGGRSSLHGGRVASLKTQDVEHDV